MTEGNNPLADELNSILDRTRDFWNEIRGNRIFITGGTGFIGTWLLESFAWANRLLDLQASCVVLSRNPDPFLRRVPHLGKDPAIRFHVGDVRTFTPVGSPFTHVIHAAADASGNSWADNPLDILETMIDGTRRTLEFAVATGADKFLLISSGAVYGPQPEALDRISETYAGAPDPFEVRSVYGQGKRLAEMLCAIYWHTHGLETKIVRCFAVVGPYLPFDGPFAVGNFIRDALDHRAIRINGDGTQVRSYLYAADLVVWLWTILCRGVSCRPYNVGSEQPITIKQLAQEVAETFESAAGVDTRLKPVSGACPKRYVPNTQRAIKELGLDMQYPRLDALLRTRQWTTRSGLAKDA